MPCFLKNRTRTDDFVLIPAQHLQFNTNLLRENKDKRSLFFYAVSRGDFLFTVRKIIKRDYGGAYKCYKYAQELGVPIMNIADNIKNQEW